MSSLPSNSTGVSSAPTRLVSRRAGGLGAVGGTVSTQVLRKQRCPFLTEFENLTCAAADLNHHEAQASRSVCATVARQ
jgi:hypothetical protein